jgi:chromosome segregation ATPase
MDISDNFASSFFIPLDFPPTHEWEHLQEIKKLKSQKIIINVNLEKKCEEYNTLLEENKNLNSLNKKLLNDLKESKNFSRIESLTAEETSGNPLKEFLTSESETENLQKEIDQLKIVFESKRKKLNETKRKIKKKMTEIEKIEKDKEDILINFEIMREELKKLEEEYSDSNKKIQSHNYESNNLNNYFSESLNITADFDKNILAIKKAEQIFSKKRSSKENSNKNLIENLIQNLNSYNEHLSTLTEKVNESIENFYKTSRDIEEHKKRNNELLKQNEILINKIDQHKKFIEDFKRNAKKEYQSIKSNLAKSKSEFKKIEEEINYKLYFIRFSNSLVRSFFNIINTRRIQIDIMKKFKTEKREKYKKIFDSLDELEATLLIEYNQYMTLCEGFNKEGN